MTLRRLVVAVMLGLVLFASRVQAGTCFQMRAEAEKMLGPGVAGKLVWARADEGQGIDPAKWTFLFYDPSADDNGRRIVVINGNVTAIEQGVDVLDHARLLSYKRSEVMPPSKLQLDSNQALAKARAAAHLRKIPLSTVHYELQMDDDNVPVWTLNLFTQNDDREVLFCTVRLSARTGRILDLKLSHA